MKRLIGIVALGFVVVWAAGAQAGEKPAVSAINGKIDATTANLNQQDFQSLSGSVAAPIGHSFGVQADGMLADYSANDTWGVGGHAFWRDPDLGLAGVVGSITDVTTTKIYRTGLEGEYYLNQFTVAATAGIQRGDSLRTGWGGLDLRYYPMDDLVVEAGASAISKERVGHVGFEWQAPFGMSTGVSLFADAAKGTSQYDHVMGGIRIYFGGGKKSLKRRHREDDPVNMLIGGFANSVSGSAGSGSGLAGGNRCAFPTPDSLYNAFGCYNKPGGYIGGV